MARPVLVKDLAFLRSTFKYENGCLVYKKYHSGLWPGDFMCNQGRSDGRKQVRTPFTINGNKETLHSRLVYLYHYGEIPKGLVIDHIDGDASNDDINNLRCISREANQRNHKQHCDNSSGVGGVSFNKQKAMWQSYIGSRPRKRLYYGPSFAKAVLIRKAAEYLFGYTKRHGGNLPMNFKLNAAFAAKNA